MSRSAFEDAKGVSRSAFRLELAALTAGVATLVFSGPQAHWVALVALVLRGGSWLLRRAAAGTHACAERLRTRALISDSFGETLDAFDVIELKLEAKPKWERTAVAFEDPNYYASRRPPGLGRFRDNLQESTFYSKDLYAAAGSRAAVQVILAFGVSGLALLALVQVGDSGLRLVMARGLVVVLASAWMIGLTERALNWRGAASQIGRIDRCLDKAGVNDLEPIVAAYGDYSSVVAAAPAIPTDLYIGRKQKLEQLWRERTRSSEPVLGAGRAK